MHLALEPAQGPGRASGEFEPTAIPSTTNLSSAFTCRKKAMTSAATHHARVPRASWTFGRKRQAEAHVDFAGRPSAQAQIPHVVGRETYMWEGTQSA